MTISDLQPDLRGWVRIVSTAERKNPFAKIRITSTNNLIQTFLLSLVRSLSSDKLIHRESY